MVRVKRDDSFMWLCRMARKHAVNIRWQQLQWRVLKSWGLVISWTVLVPSDGFVLKEGLGMTDRRDPNAPNPVHGFTPWRWDRSVPFTQRYQIGLWQGRCLSCSSSASITRITVGPANLVTASSYLPWNSHSEVWWLILSSTSSRGLAKGTAAGVTPVNVTGLHPPRSGETEQELAQACSQQLVVSWWEESSKD